ncbi:MAG: hypothetical protein M3P06_06510 [Acidobacteriota bacterium]|nr:hypothetical protein [Acidobacteriota bacterium]
MRRGSFFLVLLLANTISAATQFKFVTESTGDPLHPRSAGTIRVDGVSYRIDGDEANLIASASFSTDGGKTVTRLNQQLSTYYRWKVLPSEGMSTGLYDAPFLETSTKPVVSVKNVLLQEEPTDEVIAGYPTRKYVLTFDHDVRGTLQGEKLRVIFRTTALIWTTEKIELAVAPIDLRVILTGRSAVDPAVREALSGVKGFPLKRRLAVTRRYEGGAVMVDVVTTTFDEFKTVDLPPEALTVPSGYRYQEPVIGFPGI